MDVLNITEIDKNGKVKPAGYIYLKWLVEKADWYRHKSVIRESLNEYGNTLSDVESKTKEIVEEIKRPKIKKEAKPKKTQEGTVKISTENNVLEFQ